MPVQGDPIRFNDYNALWNSVSGILGPINGDLGYGLSLNDLSSYPYPFERSITLISRGVEAEITTSAPHGLVATDLIFLTEDDTQPINSQEWRSFLQGRYVTVVSVTSTTKFRVNLDTSGLSVPFSGVWLLRQFVVTANQFSRLKTDLDKMRQHQVGSNTSITLPTRGSNIRFTNYSPFFTEVNARAASRFFVSSPTLYQPPASPRTYTNTWQNSITSEVIITWPTVFDIQQFFNTGGYVQFEVDAYNLANSSKDRSWSALCNKTPVNYGAYNNTTMGTRPGTWCSAGFYNATGDDVQCFLATHTAGTYTAYSTNRITISHRLFNDRAIRWVVALIDNSLDTFVNRTVTADIDLRVRLYYPISPIPLRRAPNNTTEPYQYQIGFWTGS